MHFLSILPHAPATLTAHLNARPEATRNSFANSRDACVVLSDEFGPCNFKKTSARLKPLRATTTMSASADLHGVEPL